MNLKKKSKSFYIQELKSKNNILYYVGDTKSDKEETKKKLNLFLFLQIMDTVK